MDINNLQLYPGTTYEIEYEIPDNELSDRSALQNKMTRIISAVIKDEKLRYVKSRLEGNKFFIQIKLRETVPAAGLGLIPLLLPMVSLAVFTILLNVGLNWTAKSVREVSSPITELTKPLLPVLIGVGAILLLPKILSFLGDFVLEKKR